MVPITRLDELFDNLPERLTVERLATALDVSTKVIYKWLADGVIPAYKLGGSWLILRDEVKDAIRNASNTSSDTDNGGSETP